MRGISTVMRLLIRCEPAAAGSTSQEHGGGWKRSLTHTKNKWHNDEINNKKKYSCFIEALWRETTTPSMFPLCPCSHCNNVLLTDTDSCCEHTLFNRLFSGQVQCQRTLCTRSWYIVAQCKHSLEMRAPIHIQTESKLLLSCSCQTEMHIVPSFSSESILLEV